MVIQFSKMCQISAERTGLLPRFLLSPYLFSTQVHGDSVFAIWSEFLRKFPANTAIPSFGSLVFRCGAMVIQLSQAELNLSGI